MKKYIVVRTQFEGFHQWRNAPMAVDFLKAIHRHLFFIEAKIPVIQDRELEFFMTKEKIDRYLENNFPDKRLETLSCEALAGDLVIMLSHEFKIKKDISVSVFEDNENGGVAEL